MPHDQAAKLRLLVDDEGRDDAEFAPRARRAIVVRGAKGGVGTTTFALNLAVSLALVGERVEVSPLQGVLDTNMQTWAGPAGIKLVDEIHWQYVLAPRAPRSAFASDAEGSLPDWLVVDAASQAPSIPGAADEQHAILVTTPEPDAVLAAFDCLREAAGGDAWPTVVLNRTPHGAPSRVAERLQGTCRRLLGREVAVWQMPFDASVLAACHAGQAVTLRSPGCAYSRQLAQLVAERIRGPAQRAA